MPTTDTLSSYLAVAEEAARRAAGVLKHWQRRFSVREKGRFDLVTEADLASQEAIRLYLHGRFPDHGFLGEEEGHGANRPGPGAPPTWIVDPLDGTSNYVHGVPLYCVSIGLMVDGELVVGVVLDPAREELFKAAKGMGAWLGSTRIQTSVVAKLDQAMLATGFPPDVRGQEKLFDCWRHFSQHSQAIRRTGSTALNLAYVAAGRFDGYWAFDNHVWDVAGGVVLVREAGGKVTNANGSIYDPFTPDAVASNGPLQELLLDGLVEIQKSQE